MGQFLFKIKKKNFVLISSVFWKEEGGGGVQTFCGTVGLNNSMK